MKLVKRTQEEQILIDMMNQETKSRVLFLARHLRPILSMWNKGAERILVEVLIDDFERNEQLARKKK